MKAAAERCCAICLEPRLGVTGGCCLSRIGGRTGSRFLAGTMVWRVEPGVHASRSRTRTATRNSLDGDGNRSATLLRGRIGKRRGLHEGLPRHQPRLNLTSGASGYLGSWPFTARVWSGFSSENPQSLASILLALISALGVSTPRFPRRRLRKKPPWFYASCNSICLAPGRPTVTPRLLSSTPASLALLQIPSVVPRNKANRAFRAFRCLRTALTASRLQGAHLAVSQPIENNIRHSSRLCGMNSQLDARAMR